jgi:hypothetical protein
MAEEDTVLDEAMDSRLEIGHLLLATHPTLPFVDRFMPVLSPSKQVSASHRSE